MRIAWKESVFFLLLGVSIGFFGGPMVFHSGLFHPSPDKRMNRFSHALTLTSEQEKKVAAIVKVKREKLDTLRAEMKPKFDEIRKQSKEEIRELLGEDQRKKFEELEERMEKRHRHEQEEEKRRGF